MLWDVLVSVFFFSIIYVRHVVDERQRCEGLEFSSNYCF